MRILTVHEAAPNFPASDTLPGAVRYEVAGKWVDAIGGEPTEADVQSFLNPEATPQQKIAEMERVGIPEQKIDGGYIRGVREYMLGGAAMFNACNQIIETLEAKIREIGGPGYADFTAPRLPDITLTPGMQKVKSLDDQIKVLRAQI